MRHSRVQNVLKTIGAGSILMVFAAAPASAHVGLGAVHTFSQGFLHPMSGIDHIIAMVAVGFFAMNVGGAGRWLVPAAFVAAMMFGGWLGYEGWPLPMVEQGIGLSVVALSVAVAVGVRPPTVIAMAAVLPYAAGFVAATALLHLSGMVSSLCLDQVKPSLALMLKRVTGAIGVMAGAALLLGLIT